MMGGGIAGGAVRGLWNVRRAVFSSRQTKRIGNGFGLFSDPKTYLPRNDAEIELAQRLRRQAFEITQTEKFQRANDLYGDTEALEAFFGLLEASKPALSWTGGAAGYLKDIYTGKRFMGLALSQFGNFAIAHELHHFAREAIYRTKYGKSLFLMELNGSFLLKMRLLFTEELYFGLTRPLRSLRPW